MRVRKHQREAFWAAIKERVANDDFLNENIEIIPGGCDHYCTVMIKSSVLKSRLSPYKCQVIELSVATTRLHPCIWYIFNNEDNRNNLMDVISNYYTTNGVSGDLQAIANEHGNDGGRVKFIINRNARVENSVNGEARALSFLLKRSLLAILNSQL